MSEMLDHVAYLSQTIGPRPAGTEEEQQAALYLAENMKKEVGLPAVIEDFECSLDTEFPRAICAAVAFVVGFVSIFWVSFTVAALIISAVAAVVYVLEILDRPVLSRFMGHGVSQNVVAKYEPLTNAQGESRRRKIILVAHYDSGKVRPELRSPVISVLPLIHRLEMGGIIALPVILFIHGVILPNASGVIYAILLVFKCIAMALALLQVIATVVHRTSSYNEGANCNASGVAVLMEVASRIAAGRAVSESSSTAMFLKEGFGDKSEISSSSLINGSMTTSMGGMDEVENPRISDATVKASSSTSTHLEETSHEEVSPVTSEVVIGQQDAVGSEVVIHGRDAAFAQGLIPEGADLLYETQAIESPLVSEASPAARLQAAKAAIAQLTGKPVSSTLYTNLSDNLVQLKEPPIGVPSEEELFASRERTLRAFNSYQEGTDSSVSEAGVLTQGTTDLSDAFTDLSTIHGEETMVLVPNESTGVVPKGSVDSSERELEQREADSSSVAPLPYSIGPLTPYTPPEHFETPSWYKAAQQKARKNADTVIVHRSKFADALEAAERESRARQREAEGARMSDTERRLLEMRENIMSAKAPRFIRDEDVNIEAFENIGQFAEKGMEDSRDGASLRINQPNEAATDVVIEAYENSEKGNVQDSPEVTVSNNDDAMEKHKEQDEQFQESASQDASSQTIASEKVSTKETDERFSEVLPVNQSAEMLIEQIASETPSEVQKTTISAPQKPASGKTPTKRKRNRRAIMLPETIPADSELAPLGELRKQRAPLAETGSHKGSSQVSGMRTTLPTITGSISRVGKEESVQSAQPVEATVVSSPTGTGKGLDALFGAPLPDPASSAEANTQQASINAAGAFMPVGATGAFAPVGEELLEDRSPDEIYVDDVDDSAYEAHHTETGAYSGPGYVEMPKSRGRKLLDRLPFGRKRRDAEAWAQEQDIYGDYAQTGENEGGFYGEDDYEGVSYDPVYENDEPDSFNDEDGYTSDSDYMSQPPSRQSRKRRWHGGAFSRLQLGRVSTKSQDTVSEGTTENARNDTVPENVEHIYKFHDASVGSGVINTEVWIVMLGSDLAHNAGTRMFLRDHESELKGSIIIEVDACGAGRMSLIEREGFYRPVQTPSRMNRYVSKAASELGLNIPSVSILWENSCASVCASRGYQAMHLAGMDGDKPALYGQEDDVLESISDDLMHQNADFIMELLKKI